MSKPLCQKMNKVEVWFSKQEVKGGKKMRFYLFKAFHAKLLKKKLGYYNGLLLKDVQANIEWLDC